MKPFSLIASFNPESPFFTPEENRRRFYLVEKYLSNLYALEEGSVSCMENIDSILNELDEIFYTALERRRNL